MLCNFRDCAEIRSSACKMVRTLVQLMRTLDKMPDKVMNILSILHVYSIYISFQIADDRVYYFFASATAHHSDEAYVLR